MTVPTPPALRAPRLAAAAVCAALLAAGCSDPADDGSGAEARGGDAGTSPSASPLPPIDATGGRDAAPAAPPGGTAGGSPDLPAPEGEGTSVDEHPRVATFAGIRAPKPATWQWQPPRPMRAGNWTIPGRSGGDFAELTAFLGIRGGIEMNLQRWVGQFRSPEMRAVEPERWEVEVPGLDASATMVQIVGEFSGMSTVFKPGQALLGALLESPLGPIQLKLTGPEEVVLGAREDFETMVRGMAPAAEFPLPAPGEAPARPGGGGADAPGDAAAPASDDAGSSAPGDAAADAGPVDAASGWPLAWFRTAGDPPARAERHLAVEGGPAPTVELARVTGGTADLEQLRGSIVVIDFWGTWCKPCMDAIPKNIALQEQHRDDGVVFLGIHSTLMGETMEQAATSLGINYPVGQDVDEASATAWQVRAWPYYAIIGRDGTVRAAGLRPEHLDRALARVVAEQPAESA